MCSHKDGYHIEKGYFSILNWSCYDYIFCTEIKKQLLIKRLTFWIFLKLNFIILTTKRPLKKQQKNLRLTGKQHICIVFTLRDTDAHRCSKRYDVYMVSIIYWFVPCLAKIRGSKMLDNRVQVNVTFGLNDDNDIPEYKLLFKQIKMHWGDVSPQLFCLVAMLCGCVWCDASGWRVWRHVWRVLNVAGWGVDVWRSVQIHRAWYLLQFIEETNTELRKKMCAFVLFPSTASCHLTH